MKTKRRIRNIDISIDLEKIGLGILSIIVSALMFVLVAIILPLALESDYQTFERNYNDCVQAEVFTESRCEGFAYAAAFGK